MYFGSNRGVITFHRSHSELFPKDLSLDIGEGIIGYAAKTAKTQVSGDVSKDPHYALVASEITKSELAVAIKSGEKVIGVLDIQSDKFNAFDKTDVAAMETLSTQIASAIDNARLYDKAQREIIKRKRVDIALKDSEEKYRYLVENINDVIFSIVEDGVVTYISPAIGPILGYQPSEIVGKSFLNLVVDSDSPHIEKRFEKNSSHKSVTSECRMKKKSGDICWMRISEKPTMNNGTVIGSQGVLTDITERKMLEIQLLQAQKLESIGQLAAGIAHEINTPTQYVSDNVRFLQESFKELTTVLQKQAHFVSELESESVSPELLAEVKETIDGADIEYLLEEIPTAFQQSLEGIKHVTHIVRAMKEFSHPGIKEKIGLDINRAIETTITVASNEWKYVAEVETDFDPNLPLIPCLADEFNQVILNMITNGAHAIADVVGDGSNGKGIIKISTRLDWDWAEVRISDTGSGVPEDAKNKIFDPFFTTKEVGKGTGQGLSICHNVIVEKHGGTIDFETNEGKGTIFIIRLPCQEK